MKEEESDPSLLDFGGTKRHPRGTNRGGPLSHPSRR